MTRIRVVHPGTFTTVQDPGRIGHASLGVCSGGAADGLSLCIGNRLLGNPDGAAGLEMTLTGGAFEFDGDATMVLSGAEAAARVEAPGEIARDVSPWIVQKLRAGETLRMGGLRGGARTYLCVRGGVDVPVVLGSRSTHLSGGFGGLEGRALRTGDLLAIGGAPTGRVKRNVPPLTASMISLAISRRVLRVTPGAQRPRIDTTAARVFFDSMFVVSEQSDRSGLRLDGPKLAPGTGGAMPTEAMPRGAIQLPDGGQPIVLGPDGPPTGGYPVLACVASVDLPALGQIRPRDTVRFELITTLEALTLLRDRAKTVDRELPPA